MSVEPNPQPIRTSKVDFAVRTEQVSFFGAPFGKTVAVPMPADEYVPRPPVGRPLVAKIVPFEGGQKVGVYCPRCRKGGLRQTRAIALKAGKEETCVSCTRVYRLPSLDSLGLDPDQLRKLAAAALALADKIENGDI